MLVLHSWTLEIKDNRLGAIVWCRAGYMLGFAMHFLVCCILMQILRVVSQKSFSFSSPRPSTRAPPLDPTGDFVAQTPYRAIPIIAICLNWKFEITKFFWYIQNVSHTAHLIYLYKCYNTLPLHLLHNYQILLLVHKFVHHPEKSVFRSYIVYCWFVD